MRMVIDGDLKFVSTIKCKCGNNVIFDNCEKKICPHCGNLLFKNNKIKFEYLVRKNQLKERKENGKKV